MTESTASNGTVFYDYRLSNGLQIVGQPMPDFESVALSYHIRVGSRDEIDPSIEGISHFLLFMMAESTKTLVWRKIVPEFNYISTEFSDFTNPISKTDSRVFQFNKIGAEFNAFTSHEATVYYARVLGEYFDRVFELLSDMMYPRLVESDFEREKEVIFDVIARSEAEPYNRAFKVMMRTYFGNHPLGHDLLGTHKNIRNMKVEELRDFWRKHYVANNIIIAVAGNFDWEHLIHLVIRHCSNWRTGDIRRNAEYYEPPRPTKTIVVDKRLDQQIMILAMPTVDVKDPDYYAANLGGSILGDSDGSRLFWNIHQKGLAESASAGIWSMEGTGIMIMEANSTPEEAPHVLKLLRAELDSFLEDGVYEDELRRAKDKWISSLVLSSESTFARMRSLANDWVTEGRLLSVDEEVERIEKVTAEDVMHSLRRFPMRDKQVLTALGPLSEKELLA